jgi:tetratricopeptide (TPR) repeat protein
MTGDHLGAAETLEEGLSIARDLGERLGQANALSSLGVVRRMTGDHLGAADTLEEALSIYRDIGDRGGEVEALNELGMLHRICGGLGLAAQCHRHALELSRQITSPLDEAFALAGLGRCALAAGRTADARVGLLQAQEIFQRIGAAEGIGISAELDALTEIESTAQGSQFLQ